MLRSTGARRPSPWKRAVKSSVGLATAVALLFAFASPSWASPNGGTITLTGAGSTFDNPLFTSAFFTYNQAHPSVKVSYAAVGSSTGIAQFTAGVVNFGATDVPMTSDQLAQAKGPAVQVPVALGGVAAIYHVTGVGRGLKLTPATMANIFLGRVTYWDNHAIASQNPGVTLPHLKITIVHRSDGSGTTYIFTDYLSHVSSTWESRYGASTTVAWPVGIGEPGSSGVAALVGQTPGAIGYVELSYALQNHITFARIQNSAGNFILPGPSSVAAAAAAKPDVTATNFSIVDQPGSRSYPICGYSWMLIYRNQSDQATGTALVHLAAWLTHDGQSLGVPLDYVPLPASIQALATKTLKHVVGPNGPIH